MPRILFSAAALALALGIAPTAMAASDYLLELDGVDGVAPATIEISSWSWGTSNSNAGSPSGTGRLRESPTLPSRHYTTRARVAAGDLDGDGTADLASASDIQGFTLSFDKASPQLAKLCATGTHIAHATIKARAETFELAEATVTACSNTTQTTGSRDSMPNRISMNVTVPKQTQGATFGERCLAGNCAASPEVRITLTGQLKHTKTGHVTLMK